MPVSSATKRADDFPLHKECAAVHQANAWSSTQQPAAGRAVKKLPGS